MDRGNKVGRFLVCACRARLPGGLTAKNERNMIKPILIACLFLMGCVPPIYVATYQNIFYEGDSNCALFNDWIINAAEHVGIEYTCWIRRSVYDIDSLPEGDLVFLALGINAPGTREQFKARMEFLLGTTDAPVVCVLPVSLDTSADMPREVMNEVCIEENNAHIIDPLDAPVTIQEFYNGKYDGVHYTDADSQELLAYLLQAKMVEILGSDYFQ